MKSDKYTTITIEVPGWLVAAILSGVVTPETPFEYECIRQIKEVENNGNQSETK